MTGATLTLRHLSFTGPRKEPAGIEFGPGLNVVYGASDTGKSFILEAIDFMLGASAELRDIPERVGYDRIFLGIEESTGESFTLERSTAGGQYRCYKGLHSEVPPDTDAKTLAAKHNPTTENNLSMFLLAKIGLGGKRIRKNAVGETNSLSFRNLARLCLVPEQEIQKQDSPILSGQWASATPEYSTFKLLLTGVDDSAVQPAEPDKNRRLSRAAKAEVIDELIADYRDRLASLVGEEDDDADLRDQLTRLDESIAREQSMLGQTEKTYRQEIENRSKCHNNLSAARERRTEINELLARFKLLDAHYSSDLERLEGIREAGVLVLALDNESCPLCGAAPESQHLGSDCDGNIDAVVAAVDAEHKKIVRLRKELRVTVSQLMGEADDFDDLTPKLEAQLQLALERLNEINPSLSAQRAAYSELINKRSTIQNAINLLRSIEELEGRKAELDTPEEITEQTGATNPDISHSTLDEFAKVYEEVLKNWSFPESDRVHFDRQSDSSNYLHFPGR